MQESTQFDMRWEPNSIVPVCESMTNVCKDFWGTWFEERSCSVFLVGQVTFGPGDDWFASDDSLSVHVKLRSIHFIHFIHFPCHIMSPYVTHVALRCTSLHCVALHPPGKMWMAPWSYFQHLVLRLLQTRPLHHGELWSLMEARLARKPPKFQIVAMRRNFRDIPPGWAQCKKMNEWLDPALPRSLNWDRAKDRFLKAPHDSRKMSYLFYQAVLPGALAASEVLCECDASRVAWTEIMKVIANSSRKFPALLRQELL